MLVERKNESRSEYRTTLKKAICVYNNKKADCKLLRMQLNECEKSLDKLKKARLKTVRRRREGIDTYEASTKLLNNIVDATADICYNIHLKSIYFSETNYTDEKSKTRNNLLTMRTIAFLGDMKHAKL